MKRIGVLIVAYNAASTLASVLDRIPRSFAPRISKVIVNDDCSKDGTFLVGLGYRQLNGDLPLEVIRHERNLGYGGNQKAGYKWAIEQGLDIVVLLHGDGQYPPEMLPEIVAPLERGDCDAVFGSRMMEKGAARRGGMPMYKFVGNRILTTFENTLTGMSLSEWHSGFRAYSVPALADLPFTSNSDRFDFDTQIILQMHEAGKTIVELPIPTYYGDEICYVNGMKYASDIVRDVATYRAHKIGLGTGETAFATPAYEQKSGDETSHARIVSWLAGRGPCTILDLGCSDGRLGERLREHGHTVIGIDIEKHDGVGRRLDGFVEADLDHGIPPDVADDFDVVLAADVLEHVREPRALLLDAITHLNPYGSIIASVPNFAHWYPRARVALGRFDYDRRGILDSDHVRFFTRRSFERLARSIGLSARRSCAVGVPLEAANRGAAMSAARTGDGPFGIAQRIAVDVWPTMFGFQFVYELELSPDRRAHRNQLTEPSRHREHVA